MFPERRICRASVVPSIAARRVAASPRRRRESLRACGAAWAEAGNRRHGDDRQGRHHRREGGQPERELWTEQAERHRRSQHRDGEEVDAALDQEERDRPAGDPLAVHAAAVKHPRPECQPAGAAGRNERPHRQLRPADLPASPPGQPGAEDRPEHDQVGNEREALEERCKDQPARVPSGQLVAYLTKPWSQQEDGHQGAERGDRL